MNTRDYPTLHLDNNLKKSNSALIAVLHVLRKHLVIKELLKKSQTAKPIPVTFGTKLFKV